MPSLEILHPDNKVEYKNGDHIEFLIPGGDMNDIKYGRILGISTRHIIDFWIVEPFVQIGDWTCWSIQHTFIRPINSNKPFLCQLVNKDFNDYNC